MSNNQPSLNESQRAAIHHTTGPARVLAGPGSGKTLVLTHRIRHLINECHVNPANILVITFTRAAAAEMKSRFYELMGNGSASVTFGTFHSVYFHILRSAYRMSGDVIITEERKQFMLREIVDKLELDIEDENDFVQGILGEISLVKGEMLNLEHYYAKNCPEEVFRQVFTSYQEALAREQKIDFDDIMVMCLELLTQRPDILAGWQKRFTYILIDEFQDINLIQYRIARMLAAPENNLFIVGDDDQSIYRFRGAKPEIMLNFTKDYPGAKEISLSVNYRSQRKIVSAASKVIEHNAVRLPKKLTAASAEDGVVTVWPCPTIKEEYEHMIERIRQYLDEGYSPGDIAILFRTNMGQNNLVGKLMEHNLPFTMGSYLPNLFEHWAVQDILTYMKVACGSRERRDVLRIINKPNRYVSRGLLNDSQISFEALKEQCGERQWIKERLDTFEETLAMIRRMVPYGAVRYIRKAVGYDEYVVEYAKYRRMDPKEIFAVLDELESAVEGIRTYPALLKHIEKYTETLLEKAKESKSGEFARDRIVVRTMHSAKGLEYPIVLLPDVNEGVVPHSRAAAEADIEEERRLFYVAMTRAKKRLHIFYVKERYSQKSQCSRYVDELLGTGEGKQTR